MRAWKYVEPTRCRRTIGAEFTRGELRFFFNLPPEKKPSSELDYANFSLLLLPTRMMILRKNLIRIASS